MRLAAIRIPKGYLPHIFGKDHDQVVINLGGKNIYNFGNDGSIIVEPNEFYLDDIFSNQIALFSCVVGGNGGGKTSLLRLILRDYKCAFIIEDTTGDYELAYDLEKFHRVYYTPYLHHSTFDGVGNNGKELSKVALIKMDNHGDGGQLDDFLDAHYSENSKRWIKFNNFYRKNQLSKTSIPIFQQVELSLKHFECDVLNPNKFNDASYQIRPAISLLLGKIDAERRQVEYEYFEENGNVNDRKDNSYFLIRFEYALYETILGKFVSILERAGNHYLNEGFIPDDYETQISGLNVRSGIEWLLFNSGVHRGQSNYRFSENLEMIQLIDYVRSLIILENLTDNWRKIIITEEDS
jgi:hypothetical protein